MLSEKEKLDKLTRLGIELNQIRDLDIFFSRLKVLRSIQERYQDE